ncbi:nucleotide sugar dehydrogenase [Magnetospirillum sp. UT-4]|uniref:nucleotide sugar dehydrogenase n=1 Tax=Magnetospirillum sp. UT-4 TaxID=2681467 RepID=UPI001383BEF0|nr:nucleotide sugar dehydrogenase [Magnetospirillum sp. UT-4]CAA7612107.1 UDP-glucose/GDP-mannose dehydrogenase [Magnetospirillum sp. UT-4]
MSLPVVGFAGMTHLGINTAAATAARGFRTLGFDPDAALVARLAAGRLPIVEPGLDDLVAANADRLGFTADAGDLKACDVVYIAADVPTDDDAKSDLAPIRALIDAVAPHLGPDAVLVVLCQVPPGFTRALTSVPHPRLVYQVETLIFGRAVERAMHPERFIVGLADPSRGLPPVLGTVLEAFACPILPMRYESAELAKISINFCLVASVSVANTLAELSEAIGADWSEITPALKLDKRIGPFAYLAPGLGISGGNLERDLRTVIDIARDRRTHVGVVEAWLDNSQWRKDWPWRTLKAAVLDGDPKARIAVLGLAYKENTHSTKNSPALVLLEHLTGNDVAVHDPVVPASVVPWARGCASAMEAVAGADAVVIATPWPDYRGLKADDLAAVMRGRVVIDPYRMLDGAAARSAGLSWFCLGAPAAAG